MKSVFKTLFVKGTGYLFLLTFTYIASRHDKESLAAINLTIKSIAALTILVILGAQVKIPQIINDLKNNSIGINRLNSTIWDQLQVIFFRWLKFSGILTGLYIMNEVFGLTNTNHLTYILGLMLLLTNSLTKVLGSVVLSFKKYWISQLSDNTITFLLLTTVFLYTITLDLKPTINQWLGVIIFSKILIIILLAISIRKVLRIEIFAVRKQKTRVFKYGNENYLAGTNIINELQKHSDLIILSLFTSTEVVAVFSVIMLAPFAIQVLLQVLNLHQTNDLINNFNINKNVNAVFKRSLPIYS